MLTLLLNGQIAVFGILLLAIIFSLSLHEYGHARAATWLGDDTARLAGRLTVNPASHIDPLGLLMVVLVGFGYARQVPFNPRKMHQPWARAAVAAAGPGMNFLIAVVAVNLLALGAQSTGLDLTREAVMTLTILAQINLLLMLFNLLPLGPLDGHYIMSWLLPPDLGRRYDYFNARHGTQVFLVLIVLSVVGVPVFRFLSAFASSIMPYLVIV
ncbi:MAG: site-2 protease family protein [Gammaproteobacteria bacterium]